MTAPDHRTIHVKDHQGEFTLHYKRDGESWAELRKTGGKVASVGTPAPDQSYWSERSRKLADEFSKPWTPVDILFGDPVTTGDTNMPRDNIFSDDDDTDETTADEVMHSVGELDNDGLRTLAFLLVMETALRADREDSRAAKWFLQQAAAKMGEVAGLLTEATVAASAEE